MTSRRESLLVDEIIVPPRFRSGLNEASVASLMQSIERIGLRTPLTVRWDKDGDGDIVALVAGRHRLEACKRLGMQLVDCVTFDGSEADARLWEISENLHRADLTATERSEHVAEWVRITEEKGEKAKAQVAPSHTGGRLTQGINAAVRELGIGRTEAQRAVKIAALSPEAKEAARAVGLDDNQSALLAAAREHEPARQIETLRQIAERGSVKQAPAPLNDIETEEVWRTAMMRVWNRGAKEWRERFLSDVDAAVFDNTRAA